MALGESWSQLMNPKALHDLICGPITNIGTGWLPKTSIISTKGSGQLGAFSSVVIEHVSGETSTLKFGTYQSGDKVIMGGTLDFILIDECPSDKNILPQCVKRTWTTKGSVLAAFTPEKGLNETVKSFWDDDGIYHDGLIHATLFDSGLYTDDEKQEMVASIEPWQRNFSIYGNPSAGSSAVFGGIIKENIMLPPPEIQPHWKRLASIDFGLRDTNVILFGALDEATGNIYVYNEIANNNTEISDIAPGVMIEQQGYIQLVWPVDGKAERGIGTTLIKEYERYGVITTENYSANWHLDPEGKNRSISPGIVLLRNLFLTGKLHISPQCATILSEFDLYQYDDNGKFVDKNNHAIDSLRYLVTAIEKYGISENDSKSGTNGGQAYIPEDSW